MSNDAAPEKRKPGRPRIMPAGSKRLTVSLGFEEYAAAEKIGGGNVSEGIRKALREWKPTGGEV